MKKKMKFKTIVKHFFDGKTIAAKFMPHGLHNRKWLPISDENGAVKCDTREESDAYIADLEKSLEQSEA